MNAFETRVKHVLRDRRFSQTLLIGGLLSFIPVLNFFALGYVYQMARQVRERDDWTLLSWREWDRLFIDGFRFFILAIALLILPLLVAVLLSTLVVKVFGPVGIVAYVWVSIVMVLSCLWLAVVLYRFQKHEDWSAMRPRRSDLVAIRFLLWEALLPVLAVTGWAFLASPLYGFGEFLGALLLFPYLQRLLADKEARPTSRG